MDVTSLKAVIADLSKKIIPSRFEKAQQSDPNTIQLGLRTLKGLIWIEISWDVEAPRFVEVIPQSKIGSKATLANQIHHGLKGLALLEIKQQGFERIIHFSLGLRPGGDIKKTLVIELMGRHSNLFLLDQSNKVITLGRQVRDHQSRLRPISTGDTYVPPPPLKGLPPNKEESFRSWKERLSLLPINFKRALQETYQGISPSLALQLINEDKEIAKEFIELKVDEIKMETWLFIYGRWIDWLNSISQNKPIIYFSGPTDYKNWTTKKNKVSHINVGLRLGEYYNYKINQRKSNQLKANLEAKLSKVKKEQESALFNQESLLKESCNHQFIKEKADRILCLESPKRSEIEEAQKLYKKVKKLKRSTSIIKGRIELTKQRITEIEESITMLENVFLIESGEESEKLNRLIDLKHELEEYIIKSKNNSYTNNTKKEKLSHHLEIFSPDGLTIQIGRNHRQNEFISIKKARKGDLWFHAQECPGSHIVLKASIKSSSESDIQLAADYAALFSRAKKNKFVSVVMAPIESLQRIQGTVPGTVRYRESSVIWGKTERALKHMATGASRDGLSSD